MAIRRTLYGAVEQTAALLGCPVPVDFHKASQLNTTFGIQPDAVPNVGEVVRMRAFVMGIGSHAYTTGMDNIALPTNKNHTALDAGLFKPIPLCVREIGNDLDETHRQLYGLRRIENIGGTDRIAYYAYLFDSTTAVIQPLVQRIVDGQAVESNPFVPTQANREPTPVDISNGGTNPLQGQVGRVSAIVTLQMDAAAVAEVLNAAVLKYGSEDYAYVSEIGLVTAAQRTIQSPNGGGAQISFRELISAEIYAQIPTQLAMKDRRPGLTLTYNVGAMEPLFVNGG